MHLTNVDPNAISKMNPDVLARARLDIEYLRRWYAVATDALGKPEDAESIAEGKRIYHRIFTPKADVSVVGDDVKTLHATGPDGWAAVAMNALKDYRATQHLIGAQVVDVHELTTDGNSGEFTSGRAVMNSYLQAWHAWPDRRLRLVLGTYTDHVVYSPGLGWQIARKR